MTKLQSNDFFDEMANTAFTFEALTRIWIGLKRDLRESSFDDLVKVRTLIMDPKAGVGREVSFTGCITIYRHDPETDAETGLRRIAMTVTQMEEYGYFKEGETTIRMSADFQKPNFGYTHQIVQGLDAPAEARMLMNLKFEGVHGPMSSFIGASVKKELQASIASFPFTHGSALFRHVGNAASEMKGADGAVLGYLAFGIMIPQYQMGVVARMSKQPTLPSISEAERSFLMRRTTTVR
jgi:hypothetical protein